jgi:hypothetical protein
MDLGADVGGGNDNHRAAGDGLAVAVDERALVEQLQKPVGDLLVRLLELVEQQYGERVTGDALGDDAAARRESVAGRTAEEHVGRRLRLMVGHVQADHAFAAAEQILRQQLRRVCLADARGADEQEDAERPARVGESRLDQADRARDDRDRFVLPEQLVREPFSHRRQIERLGRIDQRSRHVMHGREPLDHVEAIDGLLAVAQAGHLHQQIQRLARQPVAGQKAMREMQRFVERRVGEALPVPSRRVRRPGRQDRSAAREVRFGDRERDVLPFELGRVLEQRREQRRIRRFAKHGYGQVIRQRLQLRLEIERVGKMEIAEERHDLPVGLAQRFDQPLHRRPQILGLPEHGDAMAKGKLQDPLAGQRWRSDARGRPPYELAHECRLANAGLAGNQQAAPRRERIRRPRDRLVHLKRRRQLPRRRRGREIALGPVFEDTTAGFLRHCQ